jgi:hypothetical protein
MSINSLGGSTAASSANASRLAAAAEEASESSATTRREAQSGDRGAQRKLQASQQTSIPAQVSQAGKGIAVDVSA